MVFDDRAVKGEGVALLNVCALEFLAPSVVAFSRSALPPTTGARRPSVCVVKALGGVLYSLLHSGSWPFGALSSLGSAFLVGCTRLHTIRCLRPTGNTSKRGSTTLLLQPLGIWRRMSV